MDKNKQLHIKEYELPVILHEEDGGYVVTCPQWNDCYAQGDTVEESINEISCVASSLIELYHEEGMCIPLKLKSSSEKDSRNFSLSIPVIVSSL